MTINDETDIMNVYLLVKASDATITNSAMRSLRRSLEGASLTVLGFIDLTVLINLILLKMYYEFFE
jgi:hypothetical protein